MTEDEVHEASELTSARINLRWNVARNLDCTLNMSAADGGSFTTSARVPASIGRQVWAVTLALIEARLRELGVEVGDKLEHDCYECCGSGKRAME